MTKSFLQIAVVVLPVLARHVHAAPGHQHDIEKRQLGIVQLPSTPNGVSGAANGAAAVPVAGGAGAAVPGATVPNANTGAIPGTGTLPGASVPNVPANGVPAVNPALPAVASPQLPAVNTLVPPVATPGLPNAATLAPPIATPGLPNVNTLAPPVATPGLPNVNTLAPPIATPGLPNVNTLAPPVATPGVPNVNTLAPPVATPGLPNVNTIVPAVSTPAVVAPNPSSVLGASPANLQQIASDLDACFVKIPQELIQLASVINQRLQLVQGQLESLAGILNPNLPVPSPILPPIVTPPVAVPAVSTPQVAVPPVSTPAIVAPGLPPVATPALPSVAAPGVPSVSVPAVPPVTSVASAAAVFVSQDPGLCPPPNGLGPMVPCSKLSGAAAVTTVSTPQSLVGNVLTITSAPVTFVTMTDFAATSRRVSATPSPYIFNADARDNLAVYYGSSPTTWSTGLADLCRSNADIVILSFLHDFFSANGMPSIDIGGSACSGPTASQLQYAPGLNNCPSLATQIHTCQSIGKKVFLSLGGYIANSSFTSDLEAKNFAITVWNLFGAGTTLTPLRPFGDAIIDGIDIDNEDGDTAHWDAFTSALRALFNSDPSKTYYISAAPQCPYPDVSIPSYTLQHADFVWVQFYNNPSCNLDSNTFQSSFVQWSRALRNNTVSKTPRIFIGAGSFPGAGTGFVPASAFSSRVSLAKELFVNNFGGVMLWDGGEGLRIVDQYGHSYLQYAKWALQY